MPLVVEMREYWGLDELALEASKSLLHFQRGLEWSENLALLASFYHSGHRSDYP